THIIGIDRGERHLLYLTLIDSKGKIKRQMSLNDIISEYKAADGKNVKVVTAYRELLDTKEKERDEARKSWGSIEQIKDLKEGYLSQIVHQIAKMVVQYNAIVVLEDLNMGFKRGRQKVEKQVYQKFEKMLIDKLNYLVFKEKEMTEAGGILKAYQLTNKFQSFKKMSKQNGILFFVPAHFTSKIDPVTGFVSFFYNRYESVEKSVKFFRLFDSISYNKTKDWFEFDVDYNKFTERAKNSKSQWKLCSYGQRIETFRNPDKNNNWDSRSVGLTAAFKELLNAYGIDYMASDILSEIANQDSKEFHQPFMHLFRLMVQMRNSQSGTEVDYLQSPVAPFFNSEEQQLLGKTEDGSWKAPLPVDSDGNGAYNIARKGMWIMQRIKQAKKSDKVDLKMTNDDWLQFVQKLASNH
ncbi:MAG: type V CRISPR-associated protein Cas12a/Cpf1, partial [Flavobacteriales bacterium]|nr:type V CRISPR-associated protein Cas12a/Cpf1 [Flavobacteriales bacterium]